MKEMTVANSQEDFEAITCLNNKYLKIKSLNLRKDRDWNLSVMLEY